MSFVRDAADVERHRRLLGDVVQAAEMQPVAAGEVLHRDAGGQDLHRRMHAIAGQPVAHRGGGHDHRVHCVALRARHAPRQAAQRGGGQGRARSGAGIPQEGVIGQQRWPAAGARGVQPAAVGGEGGSGCSPDRSPRPRAGPPRSWRAGAPDGPPGRRAGGGRGCARYRARRPRRRSVARADAHPRRRRTARGGRWRSTSTRRSPAKRNGNHQHPDHGPSMRAACYRAVKLPRRDVIDPGRGASMRQSRRLSLSSCPGRPSTSERPAPALCAVRRSPEPFPRSFNAMLTVRLADEVTVGQIVCRDLLECGPDVALHEAALRTAERRVSSILVVEGDVVLGIWDERDALAVDFGDLATFTLGGARGDERAGAHGAGDDAAARAGGALSPGAPAPTTWWSTPPVSAWGIVSQSEMVVLNQGIEHYLKLRKVDSRSRAACMRRRRRPASARPRAACARAGLDAVVVDFGAGGGRGLPLGRYEHPHRARRHAPGGAAAPGSARWAKSPPGR